MGGMAGKKVKEVSGHSIRVGATQDLLELNIDFSVGDAGGMLEEHGHADALRRKRLGGTRWYGAGRGDSGTE